ncbi:MAG TPA: ATP-binding protein [Gemmatimonadales bacterium]|jgi:two-component system sensor histidine kinase PilS (NtrC family)|nr:ATP-binding protein [Gemmatimonadales bacterium]
MTAPTPQPVVSDGSIPPHAGERRFGPLEQRNFLRWLYLGRALLAAVVLVRAALDRADAPDAAFTALLVVLLAYAGTGYGFYVSFVRRARAGLIFLLCQAATDLLLVTTLVHFEGIQQSGLAALYVLVIAVYALLMPLRLGLLTAALGMAIFLADAYLAHPIRPGNWVWGQVAIITIVFLVVAFLGQRLRVASAEQTQLESELRRVQLEADEILRNIRSGVLTVDGQGRLAFLNLAAEHLLGISAERVGLPILDELQLRSPELWAAVTAGIRKGRRVSRAEGKASRADGRSVPIGLSTTTFARPSEALPSVTAIFTDISDLQQIQGLHLRAERLEAVAALSASLAHEIRNPLASIRSSVEQLARIARDDPDDRLLADLIVKESDRLSRLLGEFLDFSRVRASHFVTVDLTAVVRGAAQLVREHPDTGPGVDIIVQGEEVEVEADEDLLHRIATNLILNAAQAMNGAGRIEVSVDLLEPRELPRGSEIEHPVRLRVHDDGPGIDAELQGRLFQPFVSGRPGGSGLGLAIVQRAVAAHRGLVLLESAPGRGTTFTILLNAKSPQEEVA